MSTISKRLVIVVTALAVVVALPGVAAGTGGEGTGTPGYYHKIDHWPAHWATNGITVGGVHYDAQDAIDLINMPVKGDKTLTMFPAVVAALINVGSGNESGCIYDTTLVDANNWMAAHPPKSKVKANSDTWDVGEPLYWRLDAYNNGLLCAPSRG